MRKRSGQVHSRESSATLQLTVSLLYQQEYFICYLCGLMLNWCWTIFGIQEFSGFEETGLAVQPSVGWYAGQTVIRI